MAQASQPTDARTQLPGTKTFWNLVNKPIAESLLFTWCGLKMPGKPTKDEVLAQIAQAQVTIDWSRIARWLKTQASDPGVTPPEGVEPHHWALDREFYMHCRADHIKVDPIRKSNAFGLRPHMEPKVLPQRLKRPRPNPPSAHSPAAASSNRDPLPDATPPQARVATGAATAASGSGLKESAQPEARTQRAAACLPTGEPPTPAPQASATSSGVPGTGAKTVATQARSSRRDTQVARATQPAPASQIPPQKANAPTTRMLPSAAQITSRQAGPESAPREANGTAHRDPVHPQEPSAARVQDRTTATGGALTLPHEREPVARPNPTGTHAPGHSTAQPALDKQEMSRAGRQSDSVVAVAERQQPDTPAEVFQGQPPPAPPQPASASKPIAGDTAGHWSDLHQQSSSQEVVLWDASNAGEYTKEALFILRRYKFPGGDNEPPSLPPTTADRMKANMPVAVRGIDPRPSEEYTENRTQFAGFTSVGVIAVWFWPEDRVFYTWSRSVLDILANDPRFSNACFLVKGLDGTGAEFSLGLIERSHAEGTQSWRLPLRVSKRSSVLTRFHQVHLVIEVNLEQRELRAAVLSEERDDMGETPEPETPDNDAGAPAPKGKRRAGSSAQANKSKGKERAGSSMNRATAKAPRERKPRREPANDRDAYYVEYLESVKDTKGKLLTESKIYHDIREVTHGPTMAGERFFEAVELIDQLTNLEITDKSAPKEYAGKTVTQQAVAVFLDVGKNWLGVVKDIKRLLDLHGDMEEVKEYRESISTFGIGAYAVQKGLNEAIERGEERQASHASDSRPTKRPRTTASSQAHNNAGPSDYQEDHDRPGYEEVSD